MDKDELLLMGNRIKNRRRELDMTMSELGSAIGVAASTIQRYEKGLITRPKVPVIKEIAKALGVSYNAIIGEADDNDTMPENAFPADVGSRIKVPIIGRVAAGLACLAEEYIEGYDYASPDLIHRNMEYVYLRVKGDSMQPLIMENDLVLVRKQEAVDNGTYAVVIIDGEDGVVKKIKTGKDRIELISENPYYPPRIFTGEECSRVRVFGKVIEVKRKL